MMKQGPVGEVDSIARAVEAAEQVFDPKPGVSPYEPEDAREARAAVSRLGEIFAGLPVSIAEALDGARSSGTLVSSDRLQGLAEIVQNADDAGASEVRLLVTPTDLLVTQNGSPVRLPDVLGFATPWLSTKTDDATAIGRFGSGLSALQSLSKTLEVHCAPYHFRIADPTVGTVEPPDFPPQFREPGWTTLRVPLSPGMLQPAELEAWLNRWDDSALLFLRHVDLVTLLDENGDPIRRLELSRQADDPVSDSEPAALGRGLAGTADGRSWAVYNVDIPAPSGLSRAHKATGPMTPIAVALPLEATEDGQVHAGLPVTPISSPLFVNAQFDPLTSRKDFADTVWNEALVNLVAEVWSQAVLDLFARDPQAAWQVVPLPSAREGKTPSRVVQALEAAIIEKARQAVAPRLSFSVPEHGQVNLSQLAVESELLEGILREREIARLAGLSETLPVGVRDPAGRWRSVLDDWRSHGADLPEPVGVGRALDVVGDEGRPASSTIALVAVALREGLDERLLKLRCIIAHDGRRLVPPAGASAEAVSAETVPLAEQLGITTRLHPAHSSPANGAPEVLAWLRECGALLDGSHGAEMVRRLAKAGRSRRLLQGALTDEQVRALRDAFEQIDPDEATQLGPDVGRAVFLDSYTYGAAGEKKALNARPVDSYLPRAIDRGSFSVAAGELPGLLWLSDRYARSLRSESGREGIGARRFLRLLGAETAPRLRLHSQLKKRYQEDPRQGLPLQVPGGPVGRVQALRERRAEYTLQDRDSPDLLSVIRDISQERQGPRRRRRAVALLAALGRAWYRRLSDFAEVDAADANYGWKVKGRVPAFWLASAGDVAWLDDESGTPRKPTELRVRTSGTEAIYGASSPGYLHREFEQSIRRELLGALGVSSDPTRSELVQRLRELGHASDEGEISRDEQRQNSALAYRALARSLSGEAPGVWPARTTTATPRESDLTTDQVRLAFQLGRLLLTNQGWLSPRSVLLGPPTFGDLRPFAPSIAECEPL